MKTFLLRVDSPIGDPAVFPISLRDHATGDELASAVLPGQELETAMWTPAKIRDEILTRTESSTRFRDIGQHLYTLVARDAVRDHIVAMRQDPANSCLRVLLDIVPPELSDLPWELLADDSKRLFLHPNQRFLRFHAPGVAPSETVSLWPIRALVVVGSEPDDPAVNAEDEVAALQRELLPVSRTFDLEILLRPTQERLWEVCSEFQPHIFHFIGHGDEDPLTSQPALVFNPDIGDGWMWTAETIDQDMTTASWRPRFVFLNACRTSTVDSQRQSWAVTRAFLDAGVPAVLGMQADVMGDVAGAFAAMVYSHLASRKPLDEAVTVARAGLGRKLANGLHRRDWALPALSVSVPPEQVLPMTHNVSAATETRIRSCPIFQSVQQFVGRRPESREVLHGFFPIPQADSQEQRAPRHLLAITGQSQIGKSYLTAWCMESCVRQDHQIRYIEVAGNEPKRYLDLLRRILKGDPRPGRDSMVHEPLPAEALHRFNWDVHHLRNTGERIEWDGSVLPDNDDPLPPVGEHLDERVLASFREALRIAAGDNELVLVLDRFRHQGTLALQPAEFKTILRPYLIDPIAKVDLPNVYLVLVMNDEDYGLYDMASLEAIAGHPIRLDRLDDDFSTLAREYFWYCEDEKLRKLIDTFAETKIGNAPWSPERLGKLSELVELWFEGNMPHREKMTWMR